MILILQILFSLFAALWYVISTFHSLTWLYLLSVIGVFLLGAFTFLIILFAFLIPYIYLSEKTSSTSRFKHWVYNHFASYIFISLFRVKLIVTGKENLPTNNRFVIYSNHIEYTDPIYTKIVFNKYPIAFVAKEPLFKTPLVKNILVGIGSVSIGKNADRSAMKSILESIKIVKNGQPMGIYPEGMRTYKNEMTDFKPGAFKLSQKAEADIVPVCIYNMHGIFKKGRLFLHKAYIHIFPIIKYEDYKGLDTFTISSQVKELIYKKQLEYKTSIADDALDGQ